MVVHKRFQICVAVNHQAIVVHKVANPHLSQFLIDFDLRITGACGIQQEPADKSNPQSAYPRSAEEAEDADHNESESDDLTNSCRQSCSTHAITCQPPKDRAQNPSAVERKSRYHVEDCE